MKHTKNRKNLMKQGNNCLHLRSLKDFYKSSIEKPQKFNGSYHQNTFNRKLHARLFPNTAQDHETQIHLRKNFHDPQEI